MIDFTVLGKPEPGGSKKGFYINGHVVITDANKNVKGWQKRVKEEAERVMNDWIGCPEPLDGPLRVEFVFGLRRPKTVKRQHPTVRPDTTKLVRAVEDACTGIVWRDDAQIVQQTARKVYIHDDEANEFARVIVHAL